MRFLYNMLRGKLKSLFIQRSLLYLILALPLHSAYTQQLDTLWTKTFGGAGNEMGYAVQQTADGGYIIAGWTTSFGAGDHDIYLIKTDPNGTEVWTKTLGGVDEEMGWSVQQTQDGGYIVAGYTHSFGAGDTDVYIIRTDVSGDTIWTKTFGGAAFDIAHSVVQHQDGTFVVAGGTYSFGVGNDDVYLIKIDTTGSTIWEKTYGGTGHDRAYSIRKTLDNGFIIAGYTTSFGVSGMEVYVVKTDTDGDSMWTSTYGGSVHEVASNIIPTSDSGYIMVGHTLSFGMNGDYYVVKTDINGNTIWERNYGGFMTEWAYAVEQDDDDNYLIVGWTDSYGLSSSGIYLVKLDPYGDTIWTQIFSGDSNDAAFAMDETTDGGYIIVGSTRSFGAGGEDVYLVKTEPEVGIEEEMIIARQKPRCTTIFSGPLHLPGGKKCKVIDITGMVVEPSNIQPGIYFIEIDGVVTQKVVKVR